MTKCDFCDDGGNWTGITSGYYIECEHCHGTGECQFENRCDCGEWQN